jgi:hypothetical protein
LLNPRSRTSNERISRLSGVTDPFARVSLAQGLLMKVGILRDLGRDREARATRKHLIAEFKRDPDPRFAALIAVALELF